MKTTLFSKISTWFKEVFMDKKRVFIIAGAVVLVLVAGTFLLVACGNKNAAETVTPEAVVYDPWEYTTVVAACTYDRGTKDVVCATDAGETMVGNLLKDKGAEGWELASSFTATGSGNNVTVFAFKRLVNP